MASQKIGIGLVQRLHVGASLKIGEIELRVLKITPTKVHLAVKCDRGMKIERVDVDELATRVIRRGSLADRLPSSRGA